MCQIQSLWDDQFSSDDNVIFSEYTLKIVEEFLSEFCAIERHLRELTGRGNEAPFSSLLKEAEEKNRVVKRYLSELKSFAQLRNLLSHERYDDTYLANPSESTIKGIREIHNKIVSQPQLYSLCRKDVLTFEGSNMIQDVVLAMLEHDFSQVPILYNGEIYGALSTNTITRWLGSNKSDDLFCTSETTVTEVMSHQEYADNYVILARDDNFGKAIAKFDKYAFQGKQLDAIFITDSGVKTQKILGIVTLSDIPQIIRALY